MFSRWDRSSGHVVGTPGTEIPETTPRRISDRRMLAWFAHKLTPRWPIILVAVVAMVTAAGMDTARPLLLKYLIDQGFIARWAPAIVWALAMMLLTYVGSAVTNWLRTNLMNVLGQRLVHETRLEIFEHLQRLSLSYFHRHKTGDIMSRLSNDVTALEDLVVQGTDEVITDGLRVGLAATVMVFYLNWKLALLALSPLPVFMAVMLFFARYVRPMYRRIRDELGELNARLEERISGTPVTKAFAREPHEFRLFGDTSRRYYDASVRAVRARAAFFPLLNFLTSLGILLVLWRGGLMLTAGRAVTIGTMIAFMTYLQQFYVRLGELFRITDLYNRALASLSRIFQVYEEVPEVADRPGALELGDIRGAVSFEKVSFRYQTGDVVLSDVTFSAAPGETVAVVGRSGAGKTSLVNLIPRFYDPLAGVIRVDGHDVREVTQASLRRQIAMVLQETFLFDGTITENVRYGKLEASDEEVRIACVAAHADEFIRDFPAAYDTPIGERGVKLSGGQRQRLAIARAMLANPRILILDEATSLVDTEAEQIIQAGLANLMKGRTTFIIAHRLSTVRQADKIVVIEDGAVVELADHDTLMARQGLYARMVQRQIQATEADGQAPAGTMVS